MEQKVAVVTGGSSGIGRCAAAHLLQDGYRVYSVSRRLLGADGCILKQADVSDITAVRKVVSEIDQIEGRIDLLVNAAGVGIAGAIEFVRPEDVRKQFDVNFFGLHNITQAVLPVMRRNRCGRVISISSVAAPVFIPFQAFYSASKIAVNCYSGALANEVKQFGITTVALQLGDMKTGFTASRKSDYTGDDIYGGMIRRSVHTMEEDEIGGRDPDIVGKFIVKLAHKKSVKPIYTLGFKYNVYVLLSRFIPCRLKNFIVGVLYSK